MSGAASAARAASLTCSPRRRALPCSPPLEPASLPTLTISAELASQVFLNTNFDFEAHDPSALAKRAAASRGKLSGSELAARAAAHATERAQLQPLELASLYQRQRANLLLWLEQHASPPPAAPAGGAGDTGGAGCGAGGGFQLALPRLPAGDLDPTSELLEAMVQVVSNLSNAPGVEGGEGGGEGAPAAWAPMQGEGCRGRFVPRHEEARSPRNLAAISPQSGRDLPAVSP
jgi:hypothetical protein